MGDNPQRSQYRTAAGFRNLAARSARGPGATSGHLLRTPRMSSSTRGALDRMETLGRGATRSVRPRLPRDPPLQVVTPSGYLGSARSVGPGQRIVTGPNGTRILVDGDRARNDDELEWIPERRRQAFHGPVQEDTLWAEFKKLRMKFEVRCKFEFCQDRCQSGLEEIWQNNLVVYGKLTRRMICNVCENKYWIFSWGGVFYGKISPLISLPSF